MKRILIIIGIILLVGITVFSIWYIKNDTLFIGEEKSSKVDLKNDNDNNTSEKEIINKDQEKEKQDIVIDENDKEAQWASNGEYLEFHNLAKVLEVLCTPNQDWHLDYKFNGNERVDWVIVEPYLSKNFLKKYNQKEGLLEKLAPEEITSLTYDPYTERLDVVYNKFGKEHFAQAEIKIIKENDKHKINDIKYLSIYPNDKDADVVNKDTYINGLLTLIGNAYLDIIDVAGEFKTSEEFQEKFTNNKIFGDQRIVDYELFEDEETKLMADYDNKYINVKVKIEADDGYYYWIYYRLNFEVDEYGCLKDCSYKQRKKVRGYKIGEEPETKVYVEKIKPGTEKNRETNIYERNTDNSKVTTAKIDFSEIELKEKSNENN